jgi:hypothetical protein
LTALVLAILGAMGWLGWRGHRLYEAYRHRQYLAGVDGRRQQGIAEARADQRLMAAAQPQTPTDQFATCPNPACDMDGYHLIVNTNDMITTRACVFCMHEWTTDHRTKRDRR